VSVFDILVKKKGHRSDPFSKFNNLKDYANFKFADVTSRLYLGSQPRYQEMKLCCSIQHNHILLRNLLLVQKFAGSNTTPDDINGM
jgi:hypothetical protein